MSEEEKRQTKEKKQTKDKEEPEGCSENKRMLLRRVADWTRRQIDKQNDKQTDKKEE
jgi:hypothetical protein